MTVHAWLIDFAHFWENCPTGVIPEWMQKVTEHNGKIQYFVHALGGKTPQFSRFVGSGLNLHTDREAASETGYWQACSWHAVSFTLLNGTEHCDNNDSTEALFGIKGEFSRTWAFFQKKHIKTNSFERKEQKVRENFRKIRFR